MIKILAKKQVLAQARNFAVATRTVSQAVSMSSNARVIHQQQLAQFSVISQQTRGLFGKNKKEQQTAADAEKSDEASQKQEGEPADAKKEKEDESKKEGS